MSYTRKQLPKYCLHKSTGRAFVRIEGKAYYLGKHGSAASRQEYDRIIGEFIANGRQAKYQAHEILVEQLLLRYLDYAEKSKLNIEKRPLQLLNDLYGKQPAIQFGTSALKAIRQQFLDQGLSRATINNYINSIRRVVYWGCDEEIIPADIAVSLKVVRPLKAGRTSAVEYDPVQPVSNDHVEKTRLHLADVPKAMVKLQRLLGGRPQDVCNMRFCDIDRSGDIWKYVPFIHKTKRIGKKRELPIGPRGQQILLPYFEKITDKVQFIFLMKNGKPWQSRGYWRVIHSACDKADIPRWSPNQLRHAAATEIRDKFGLEYAQASLGHASANTTEIYAKVAFEKAAAVAREIG
jgi:site-specific recombinase XerD